MLQCSECELKIELKKTNKLDWEKWLAHSYKLFGSIPGC